MLLHWHFLLIRRKPTEAWRHAFMSHNFDTMFEIMLECYIERGYECRTVSEVYATSLISQLQ